MAKQYTFAQFKSKYPDDEACLNAILLRKYGKEFACPSCGVVPAKLHRISGRRAFACQDCGHHVYPCAGTVFEHSSTSLTLWFHAMYLMTATRNGVAAKELQRQLGVTYKCAWRIGHQLRVLMAARAKAENPGPMSGHIEIDETYVGSRHKGKRDRGAEGKTIVFGMLKRTGAIKARIVPDVKRKTLRPLIAANVEAGSVISSDEFISYKKLAEMGYTHGVCNHAAEQYVVGIYHVNGVEGFRSHLKRGIVSTHASVSPQHLRKYVDEFSYRYNHRHEPAEMFKRMLSQITKTKTTSS